ncbi:MAG TPA: O-antigen ligase family protein [Alphaproteobacteria bacterium]|nr:O-antigen ligase family protein [Alphaproteobacteria bacterium]
MKSLSQPRSIPDPTFLFVLIAAALTLTSLLVEDTIRIVILAVVLLPPAAWLLIKLFTSAEAGVILLIVAGAMPRGNLEVGGLNARAEHIAAGVLCLSLPFLIRRQRQGNVWMFPDYALAAYIGLNIFSSIFMSVDPSQTLKWSMQQMLAILPYFFLRVLIPDEAKFSWAIRIFIIVGILVATYGVLAYYSSILFGTTFGMALEQYEDMPATYGTQFEPNLLGAVCGAFAVFMLAMYLQQRRKYFLAGYGIAFVGMVVSLSRGALGASFIGFLALAYFAKRMRLLNRHVISSILIATLCVGLICLPLAIQFSERLSTLKVTDPTADGNTFFRLVQFVAALDNIVQRPVFGNGTASFQLLFNRADADIDIGAETPWIANSELRIVHDTGFIGFIVFMVFLCSLIRRSIRLLRTGYYPVVFALLISLMVYSISFQVTEGTILAFTWVHLGLLGCAVHLFGTANRNTSASTSLEPQSPSA